VQQLARRQYPALYLVYTGGDDLLAVGPWDQTLDFAMRVASDYSRFTRHPQLGVSAGLALFTTHTPIGRIARAADEALERSKEQGRDRLTALGETLPWRDWPAVRQAAQEVLADAPATALLYRLREYGQMWRDYRTAGRRDGLRMQPLLAYAVARNVDAARQRRLHAWASGMIGLRPGDSEQRERLDRLGVVAGLALLARPRPAAGADEAADPAGMVDPANESTPAAAAKGNDVR
jgi:CRISPR-associated protein Csm1